MTEEETKIFNTFKEDLRLFLLTKFQQFLSTKELHVSKGAISKLEQMDAFHILRCLIYNTARHPSGKKQVLISKELKQSVYFNALKRYIMRIKTIFEQGQPITPYLSKKRKKLFFDDQLLNDWGIVHLHICPKSQNLGNWLLFIYEYEDIVFFLDIKNHNFKDVELLKIIDRNWNNLLPTFDLPVNENPTERQIKQLRKLNIIYPISLGPHKVFMGQSHPLSQKRQIIPAQIYRILEDLSMIVDKNLQMFQDILREKFKNYNMDEDFHLVFDDTSNRVYLYEKKYSVEFHITNVDYMDGLKNLLYNAGIFYL